MPISKTTKILRYTTRTILITIASLLFVFALLSRAEMYGKGIKGIIMNSPNALPWLVLFIFIFIAWKWELVGGVLIMLLGIFSFFFFHSYEPRGFWELFIISLPLLIFGGMLVGSWYLERKTRLLSKK